MKNTNSDKKSLVRQLVSGAVYVALAAVVVAVTVNTTANLLSGNSIDIPDAVPENINTEIPEIPPLFIPEISSAGDKTETNTEGQSQIVSEHQTGVDSAVTENIFTDEAPESSSLVLSEIPDDADLGINKFIKPCDGYVQKEHSAEIPVYSPTMSDYRVHVGADVTGELGTPVNAVIGGIVTDIYNDDLYGKTVCMKSRDGYTVKYSNLAQKLCGGIDIGSIVKTGDSIGGIGDTALCESVDSPHVHIEIYDSDGLAIDPENLISF